MSDPYGDFEERRKRFDLSSPTEVLALLEKSPDATFLDVRSPPEILVSKLGRPTISIWCTMSDTSALDKKAPDLLPDKTKPIIAFCAVGGRSNEARKKLREMGYETVLNAGGLKDMSYIK